MRHNKSGSLSKSFTYAWDGVRYALANERNFKIHTVFAIAAAGVCIAFRVEAIYSFMVIYAITFVMSAELVNTAIEALVDLYCGKKISPLAKVAKDCCAGAVLLGAIQAVLIAVIVGQHIISGL